MRKLISFLLFSLITIHSFGYVNIYPTNFDKQIDNGDGTHSFFLTNTTKNPIAYRVFPEKTDSDKDMTEWIDIYPTSIKLDIGETKEIKIQVTAPKSTPRGEYISNLVIKEIENPLSRKNSSSTQLKIYTELRIEIAGFVGDLTPKIQVENFQISKNKLQGKLKNIGESRINIELFLSENKDDKKEVYLGSARLLVNDEKNLSDFSLHSPNSQKKFQYLNIRDINGNLLTSLKI